MAIPERPVIIVGGSAAGFYAAARLAEAGLPVRLYEATEDVDPAPRTLIVTDKFREQMGELAERTIANQIRTFELFANGDRASVELQRPDLIIERNEVIRVLAERARAAGAQVLTRRRLVSLEAAPAAGSGIHLTFEPTDRRVGWDDRRQESRPDNERRQLPDRHERVGADVVIGADGAFSTVARCAGWPPQPTVPLVQAIVELPADMAPDSTRVWFVPEDTPYFYWLIPGPDGTGALGLIGDERRGGKNPREALEGFLAKQGLQPLEFQGGRIPLYVRWIDIHRNVGDGDVYLMGDAAGQVKVSTVGGIVTGFRGAKGVVDALIEEHENGARRPRAANARQKRAARRLADNGTTNGEIRALRRELDLHMWIRRALHDFGKDDYGRLLGLLTASAKSQLGRFHRDESWRLMANLLLRRPQLAMLGIRNLLDPRGTFGRTE